MLVTLLGIVVSLHPAIKVFVLVSIIALQLSLESYIALSSATTMEVKLGQPLKAPPLMLVTLLGISTEVKLEQPQKAQSPMLVTLLGITTEVKLEQSSKA